MRGIFNWLASLRVSSAPVFRQPNPGKIVSVRAFGPDIFIFALFHNPNPSWQPISAPPHPNLQRDFNLTQNPSVIPSDRRAWRRHAWLNTSRHLSVISPYDGSKFFSRRNSRPSFENASSPMTLIHSNMSSYVKMYLTFVLWPCHGLWKFTVCLMTFHWMSSTFFFQEKEIKSKFRVYGMVLTYVMHKFITFQKSREDGFAQIWPALVDNQ